jgi:AbrB family looped-hinge helix DNA binding protein
MSTKVMPHVQVKQKYQVTIPHDIRQRINLNEGDILEVKEFQGMIVFIPKIIVPKNQVSDSEIEQCLDEAYKVLEAKKKAHYKINNKQLSQKMDRLSDKAVNNGMTSEILEDILNDQ